MVCLHASLAKDYLRWEGCGPDSTGLLPQVNPGVGVEPGVGTAFFKAVMSETGDPVRVSA